MLLKQARVPRLVEERTTYEARDFRTLPSNPFDDHEWSSYDSGMPKGKMAKPVLSSEEDPFATPSDLSFDQTVCPTSGLLAR